MAGSRKRGTTLEERLLAIRATAAVEPDEAGEPEPVEAEAEPVEAEAVEPERHEAQVEQAATEERPEPVLLGSASEGDTFLAGRVDVAVAVEKAVRRLLPQPAEPEAPAAPERAPAEAQQLSKLLTKSWLSPRKSRDVIAPAEPVEAPSAPEAVQ